MTSLQSRKQQLVREAIFDAAIDLFAANGFDETTVEEIARTAGVSRRSFFRYFASKDDVLAQNVLNYGAVLVETVKSSASALSPLEVVRATIASGVKFTASQPRLRQIVEIAVRHPAARRSHLSRLTDVEDHLAAAFAERFKDSSSGALRPRLLAGLTLVVMNATISSWFTGEQKELAASGKRALATVAQLFSDKSASTLKVQAGTIQSRRASP
jgi:AcrR family transcriptional regulator